jgi:hypothetical protein
MRSETLEPSLNEVMQDPIVRAVMRCDAVKESELRRLIDRVRAAYVFEPEYALQARMI